MTTTKSINAAALADAIQDAPALVKRHRISHGIQALGLMQAGVISSAEFRAIRDLLH